MSVSYYASAVHYGVDVEATDAFAALYAKEQAELIRANTPATSWQVTVDTETSYQSILNLGNGFGLRVSGGEASDSAGKLGVAIGTITGGSFSYITGATPPKLIVPSEGICGELTVVNDGDYVLWNAGCGTWSGSFNYLSAHWLQLTSGLNSSDKCMLVNTAGSNRIRGITTAQNLSLYDEVGAQWQNCAPPSNFSYVVPNDKAVLLPTILSPKRMKPVYYGVPTVNGKTIYTSSVGYSRVDYFTEYYAGVRKFVTLGGISIESV